MMLSKLLFSVLLCLLFSGSPVCTYVPRTVISLSILFVLMYPGQLYHFHYCLYICTQDSYITFNTVCTYVPRTVISLSILFVHMYPGQLYHFQYCLYICIQDGYITFNTVCTYVPRTVISLSILFVHMYPGRLYHFQYCLYICTQDGYITFNTVCTYVPRTVISLSILFVHMYPGRLYHFQYCLYICTQDGYITFNTDLNLYCKNKNLLVSTKCTSLYMSHIMLWLLLLSECEKELVLVFIIHREPNNANVFHLSCKFSKIITRVISGILTFYIFSMSLTPATCTLCLMLNVYHIGCPLFSSFIQTMFI